MFADYLCTNLNVYQELQENSNSVPQGGILSPNLFSVYMGDLSKLLVKSHIGFALINFVLIVFYTDDL